MWTLLLELKKDHGGFKAGDRIRATRQELKKAGLKDKDDYAVLGGGPAHSDLPPEVADAQTKPTATPADDKEAAEKSRRSVENNLKNIHTPR